MRIAFLNPSGQLGGAELCLLDMVAVIRGSRPDWEICAVLGEHGPLESRLAALGAEVLVLPYPRMVGRLGDSATGRGQLAWNLLRSAPQILSYRTTLRRLLARLGPEIIHTNGFKMHVLGGLAKPESAHLIWHIHDYVSCRPLMLRALRQLKARADAVITNSRSVAQDVMRSLSPKKLVPVLNVVDLDEFRPDGPSLDLPDVTRGAIRVGLVATMAWWKGHRVFLEAISKIDRSLNVHGLIIGGAVYQTGSRQESLANICDLAKRLGIGDRVTFTGFVSDPAAAMRSLDIVVHASTEPEPFGRVIVEAMACGRPVISSGTGGAQEILTLGDFALTFTPNDASSLASAIITLAKDSSLRARFGQNGLTVARAHFGRNRLASELLPIYENFQSRENLAVRTSAHEVAM